MVKSRGAPFFATRTHASCAPTIRSSA
jgi:hypothetical protein